MTTKEKRKIDDMVEAIGIPEVNCGDRIDVHFDDSGEPRKGRIESIYTRFVPSDDGGYIPVDVLVCHRVRWDRESYRWMVVE